MTHRRPNRVRGPVHDAFWTWCGKGELRLQRCQACGHLAWPPVEACEHCASPKLTWERMSGRAKIISWCRFMNDYYNGLLPLPYDAILVELEEGTPFIANPHEFDPGEARLDLPVRLVFIDCEDETGAFRLPVFGKS